MTSEFLTLVYIAALVPDQGETMAAGLLSRRASSGSTRAKAPNEHGFVWMPEDGFRNAFAQHATAEQIAVSSGCTENGGLAENPEGSLWIKALSGLYHLRGASCEQID